MPSAPPPSALPSHEARRLWRLCLEDEDPLPHFRALEARRLGGEPLQYLEGLAAFGPLDLLVDRRVLIPRPETEQLWDLTTRLVTEPAVVVDLCTGSGALALACKHAFPAARVLATEISPDAAAVAAANARRLGLDVEILVGDLYGPLPPDVAGRVDLLVANPPYVTEGEWDGLPADVRREPRIALVAGPAGTEVFDRIVAGAAHWLAPGGWFACEIGETQAAHCLAAAGRHLADVRILDDLADRPRFCIGRRP